MVIQNLMIKTGVDKLVALVREKKRISVPDAAKNLGVGQTVLEEWADFLEEEGIISIEYKFATAYLIERALTKDEVKHKEKEFHSKKEGFIRKAEITLASLDKEGEVFQSFKEHFEKLKKELGSELDYVEEEIKQLDKLENLKNNLDKQVREEEKEFLTKLEGFKDEIRREEQKYEDIVENISREQEMLDKERINALSMRESEINMKKRLEEFSRNVEKVEEAIRDQEKTIDNSELRIKTLKKLAKRIEKEITEKRKKGSQLFNDSKKHKQKILAVQEEIVRKTTQNKRRITKEIEEGRESTKRFKSFFKKKKEVEQLIGQIDGEKDDLERELIELIKKAKAFHLSAKSRSVTDHVKQLESTFKSVTNKKKKFDAEASKLSSLLKS